ncbi:MAG: DNA-3-methyladenine glycosylase [Vulcanimicrobiaceae bacterium]
MECEAYLHGDEASHAYGGKTPRNASMFLGPFHAYVYKIYGTSFCVNVTSEAPDVGAAVLVRALEPVDGLPLMRRRRGVDSLRELCRGPGRLCQALAIDLRCNGLSLLSSSELWLEAGEARKRRIGLSPRIGISQAAHRRLRYYEVGNDFLSGARHLSP